MKVTTSLNVSALTVLFLVDDHIAKTNKSFAIGEELVLSASKDICHELYGEAAVQKMAWVPLSGRTITR